MFKTSLATKALLSIGMVCTRTELLRWMVPSASHNALFHQEAAKRTASKSVYSFHLDAKFADRPRSINLGHISIIAMLVDSIQMDYEVL